MVRKIWGPLAICIALIIVTFLLFGDLEVFFTRLLKQATGEPVTYALISFSLLVADIVLPVPSSIVMYANGYVLGIMAGTAISLMGTVAGAASGYYLGRLTARGVKAQSDAAGNTALARYGPLAILMSRGVPVLSESISILCGYNNMPFRRFFWLNLADYLPVCLLYSICAAVGYGKHAFLFSFGCSILVSAGFWIMGRSYLQSSGPQKDR